MTSISTNQSSHFVKGEHKRVPSSYISKPLENITNTKRISHAPNVDLIKNFLKENVHQKKHEKRLSINFNSNKISKSGLPSSHNLPHLQKSNLINQSNVNINVSVQLSSDIQQPKHNRMKSVNLTLNKKPNNPSNKHLISLDSAPKYSQPKFSKPIGGGKKIKEEKLKSDAENVEFNFKHSMKILNTLQEELIKNEKENIKIKEKIPQKLNQLDISANHSYIGKYKIYNNFKHLTDEEKITIENQISSGSENRIEHYKRLFGIINSSLSGISEDLMSIKEKPTEYDIFEPAFSSRFDEEINYDIKSANVKPSCNIKKNESNPINMNFTKISNEIVNFEEKHVKIKTTISDEFSFISEEEDSCDFREDYMLENVKALPPKYTYFNVLNNLQLKQLIKLEGRRKYTNRKSPKINKSDKSIITKKFNFDSVEANKMKNENKETEDKNFIQAGSVRGDTNQSNCMDIKKNKCVIF